MRKAAFGASWGLSISLSLIARGALGQEPPAAPDPEPEPVEEPVAEEPEVETGVSLSQPPAKGKGAIVGIVRESKLKEPAVEAVVAVVGTKIAVLTEVDGTFRLELPPGSYEIQVSYELHKPLRASGVKVKAGGLTRIDLSVDPEESAVEEGVETVVQVDKATVEGLQLQRQRSAAAGDSVGRADIVKSNDRNAAEAAKRVVGANVEGSRFLFVRGLGERYTNALLDGFPLPSPEPDRQAVPLDLFPTQIIDSLTIVKTFTPDVPGDFAGGSIRIQTRRVPNELTVAGSLSLGFNTQSTFTDFLTYDGGSWDWLGFDDGARSMPADLPTSKVSRGLEDESGELITKERIAGYGKAMNTPLSAKTALGSPSYSGNFVVANAWPLGSWGRVGVMGALVYDRRFERRAAARVANYRLGEGEGAIDGLVKLNDLTYERGDEKVSWGALGAVTLEVGDKHSVSLTGLYTRASDKEVSHLTGFHEERAASVDDTRLSFVSRALAFGELSGHSTISALNGLDIEYGVGIARATRDEPDTRGAVYQYDGNFQTFTFEDDSSSGSHFYSEQGETTFTGKLDLTQPLIRDDKSVAMKLGGFVNVRQREFLARRFRFRPDRKGAPEGFDQCAGPSIARDCPDRLFTNDNIEKGFLELEENTDNNDGYEAGLDVYAGYVMVDAKIGDQVRVVAGPRFELSRQFITPFDPANRGEPGERTELNQVVLLPALSVIWTPIPRANVRASLTRTVARPQLRELAPFAYTDYFGGVQVRGNPELVNTSITNADLRFELFPTSREVVAVSAFYKRFADPIEQVLNPSSGNGIVTYENGLGGSLAGIELEARKSFDFITTALRPLSLITNLTLSHSSVDLDPVKAQALTSSQRPLSLQAPYVFNVALDLDYEETGTRARILYNLVGPRLTTVGADGIPDVYELAKHGLDITVGQKIGKHVEVRASATNLIDAPIKEVHDTESQQAVREEYTLGRTFNVGVALAY